MADSEKEKGAMTPSWQQAASTAATSDSNAHTVSEETQETSVLERARRFLQDEEVKLSSREKKIEFLKSKGIEEADINTLLKETDEATTTHPTTKYEEKAESSPTSNTTVVSTPEQAPIPGPEQETRPDHPPIITYPEFLTKPAKPPPLITASGLLNSLGIVAGLSTLVYGATRHLVGPMVETLTDARIDFHDNANKNLSRLVEKLEQSVSEIPASYHAVGKKNNNNHSNNNKVVEYADAYADDTGSSYDDPTELFHRDVGVQTSPPPTPDSSSNKAYPQGADGWPSSTSDNNNNSNNKPGRTTPQQEADKLHNIIFSVRGLNSALVSQAEDLAETKNVLDLFGQDLHALTYPPESFGAGNSYLYGSGRTEPDDEVRRVKNNIRSVKGVLLSTRSFPSVIK
ncbi:hypothetical protein VMCG_09557 [Cytospora schulzeri]|uniref:Peroxisomal membrane protein PEX14 n=1 Tax=Cytospora schulzeri TaxID=448051 RepID=A0A423VLX1_9PEZI|nr:hypothetical protein VMCG_09557 [Valsa malicola]